MVLEPDATRLDFISSLSSPIFGCGKLHPDLRGVWICNPLVGGFGNVRDTPIISDVGLLKDNLALALPHVFLLYSVISQTRLRRRERREKRDEEVAD